MKKLDFYAARNFSLIESLHEQASKLATGDEFGVSEDSATVLKKLLLEMWIDCNNTVDEL